MKSYFRPFNSLLVLPFCLVLILSSCQEQSTKLPAKVVMQVPINLEPPKITEMIDLGGLDIPLDGGIPTQFTDGRFSPGEWVILHGANLGAVSIDIDGIAVKAPYYFGNSPLIQIPTHLSPLKQHKLTLQTELGVATMPFYTSHYITAIDTDGKEIHLIRTNHAVEGGVEEDWLALDGEMNRPMFALISPDSRFLYAINIKDGAPEMYSGIKAYYLEIITFHLANPNKPAEINRWEAILGSSPIDASINENGTILLLGKRSFTLVNASNPTDLQLIGSKKLPENAEKTTFVDAVFLDGNKKIAFLETYSNSVYLIENNSAEEFPLLSSLKLQPTKVIPLSVDLEVDRKSDKEFWVLEGLNYRLSGDSLEKLYGKIFKKSVVDESEQYLSQVQKVQINENSLTIGKVIPLPNNYVTFFSKFSLDGLLYITMMKFDFINIQTETGSADSESDKNMFKKMTSFLWDSVSVGRVTSLNVETGRYDTVAKGVGLYYDLVDVPDIGAVFSLLKFGPSFSAPYLAPSWGVGIKSTGTYTKRKMDGHAIFPPYSAGFVAFQY
jgi:hypothetical protein